jgi:hypothetical protein
MSYHFLTSEEIGHQDPFNGKGCRLVRGEVPDGRWSCDALISALENVTGQAPSSLAVSDGWAWAAWEGGQCQDGQELDSRVRQELMTAPAPLLPAAGGVDSLRVRLLAGETLLLPEICIILRDMFQRESM